MESERWKQVKQIVNSCLDLEPGRRKEHILAVCAGDPALLAEVEGMLASYAEVGDFLETPALEEEHERILTQMLGRTIGHYQIVEKLGEGGMGVVYRAHDLHLDRFVALKLLPLDKLADPERKRRFVQEAKSASALNHPNIIHIYDIAEADGTQFLAMEYVAGKTLGQLIGRKGLPLNEALKYSIQIADALASAHAARIIHRDLKPSNIMVTSEGLVKVLDFGLAKLTEETRNETQTRTLHSVDAKRTEEGVIVGTASYMSPEQAEGKPVDARSDIFSFGSVLYEMVSGKKSFHADTSMGTLSQVLQNEPAPLHEIAPGIPPEFEKLVVRCLRKDRERRFQSMADLKVALQELKEESESGQLVKIGAGREPSRAPPGRWLMVMAAIVIVCGIVSFWVLRPTRTVRPSALKEVPLTSSPGREASPSFSPDGNQIAFSWNGEKQDSSHIYVKLIGPGTPLRITSNPADDGNPAWSPDGRTIAFLRSLGAGRFSVFLIPALGGAERKLADVFVPEGEWLHGPYLAWLPDSKGIIFTHKDSPEHAPGLFLLRMDSNEMRRLTTVPAKFLGDSSAALSPDGSALVFARSTGLGPTDLYLLALTADFSTAGEPRQITFDNKQIFGAAWSSSGRDIVFSSDRGGDPALWKIAVPGLSGTPGEPRRVEGIGNGGAYPAISRQGRRLAYFVGSGGDLDIWRVGIPDGTSRNMKNSGQNAPAKFISSTRGEFAPQYSPDGKKVAFESDRGGTLEIWVCQSNASGCVQLTSFGSTLTGLPHWSPDGQRIVFYSRVEGKGQIFIIGAEGGAPQRVTKDSWDNFFPNWSRDGRWIYFVSNRTGMDQIWKMPPGGGAPVQVTRNGGFAPTESPDGKYLYYGRSKDPNASVWRMPVEGGAESQVLESAVFFNFAVTGRGIYYMSQPDPQVSKKLIQFLSFADRSQRLIASIEAGVYHGFTVSPDERWLLYAPSAPGGSNVILVENFE